MDHLIQGISENIGWVAIAAVLTLGVVGGTVSSIVVGHSRERTRREVAAYIAEGSISVEEGERILKAGSSAFGGCCGSARRAAARAAARA